MYPCLPGNYILHAIMVDEINKLYREVHKELILNILPFWMNKAVDREFGKAHGQGEEETDGER